MKEFLDELINEMKEKDKDMEIDYYKLEIQKYLKIITAQKDEIGILKLVIDRLEK